MANFYTAQFVGVTDGTVPPQRADNRQVSAKLETTLGTKVAGQAWAAGDTIYIGRVRAGEVLIGVWGQTDTSLGATTLSVGTKASPTKYINAVTLTTTGNKIILGPPIASLVLPPLTADDDIWLTLGGGGVPGTTNVAFYLDTLGVR
jgi:hypothetical protein